jgi:hypothetical protein
MSEDKRCVHCGVKLTPEEAHECEFEDELNRPPVYECDQCVGEET